MTRPSTQGPARVPERPARRCRPKTLVHWVAALGVTTLVAAACGGEPEQTQLEREVQDYLQSVVAPAEISAVSCPPNAPIRPGSTFLCNGLVEGAFYEAHVTIIDEQGRREVRPRQAVMQVNATETALGAEVATDIGRDVQADCGDDQYLVVSVNQTFLCKITSPSTGETGNLEVKVLNENGAIEWTLKG